MIGNINSDRRIAGSIWMFVVNFLLARKVESVGYISLFFRQKIITYASNRFDIN
jgi:hypothetical protein